MARRFRCGGRGLSMGRKQRNRSLERERLRRERQNLVLPEDESSYETRRSAARRCGWCGGFIDVKATGRIPKWCSATCRQRAWEQRRAAASGRCAVEVVQRVVRVPVERERTPRHGAGCRCCTSLPLSWTPAVSTSVSCRSWVRLWQRFSRRTAGAARARLARRVRRGGDALPRRVRRGRCRRFP